MSTQLVWHQCCPGNSSWLHRLELGIDQSRGPGASGGLEAICCLQYTDRGWGEPAWFLQSWKPLRNQFTHHYSAISAAVNNGNLMPPLPSMWPLLSFSLEHLESSRPIHRQHGFPMEGGYLTLCNHTSKWGSSFKEEVHLKTKSLLEPCLYTELLSWGDIGGFKVTKRRYLKHNQHQLGAVESDPFQKLLSTGKSSHFIVLS